MSNRPAQNSPQSRAQAALREAEAEVAQARDTAADEAGQPRLEQALADAVEALEDQQAAVNIAAEADDAAAEDSGAAAAKRARWRPLRPD